MIDEPLSELRRSGWSVAVHNDYQLGGRHHTFWLLTHSSGMWCKGEWPSDAIALHVALEQARSRVVTRSQDPLPWDRIATLQEVERAHVEEVMRYAKGNRKQAAKLLGIGERTLYRRLEELALASEATGTTRG